MTLQKNTLLIAGLLFTGMISCNSAGDAENTVIENAAPVEAVPPSELETALSAPATAPQPVQNQTLALNPAHGQPGHDCAVAVGAPLTGSASAPVMSVPTTPITSSGPVANPAAASTPTFNSNARLNPAHGQPGHDCAVAVGAPLPSR